MTRRPGSLLPIWVQTCVLVSKLVRQGKQPISIGGGIRYWADSPEGGPEGTAFRLSVTFLFPT